MFLFLAVVSVFRISGTQGVGSADDFRRLFDENYSLALRYFRRQGASEAVSEELCQDTFLRAYRSFTGFRGEAQPRTWLMHIAKNVWRSFLRDRSTEKRQAEEVSMSSEHREIPLTAAPLIDDVIGFEKRDALRAAIQGLPTRMRQCVWLRVYQDMSYKEIATVLGIGISSAKSQVSLAAPRLQKVLGDRYPELLEAFQERRS